MRTRPHPRRRTVLTSALGASVLALALTGCGGGETAVEDTAAVDSASSASPESSDAAAEDNTADDAADDTADSTASQPGGYDAKELLAAMKAAVAENDSTHMTMDISGGGQTMTGEGDVSYAGDSTTMQMVMDGAQMGAGAGKVEVRLVDRVMYMAMPPMTPKGKFLELDLDDPNSPFGDLGGVTQGDPLATFKAFDAGLKKVKYLGEEDVDGEPLDHYVLTVDGDAAAKAGAGVAGGAVPSKLTYDLWLDGQDLMRRIEYSMQGGGVTMTMSDWGKPVSVKAPPKSAILQMPDMAGSAG